MARRVLAALLVTLTFAGTASAQRASGLQVTPDGRQVLINKDVGEERWTITMNLDGTASGNVFTPGVGAEAQFVWCDQIAEDGDQVSLECFGADQCAAAPCTADQWTFIGDASVPQTFFLPEVGVPGGWVALPDLAGGARQEHPVVALRREIYVVGGFTGSGMIVPTLEAYDPATGIWRTDIAPLPVPMHHANVAVSGEKIYVLGFLTGTGFVADGRAFAYDPDLNSWSERAPMPAGTERGASGVATIDGRIYVAGGSRGGSVADFSVYDPALNEWEILPALPVILDHLTAGAVDSIFYALGGRSDGIAAVSGAVHRFDPAEGEWTRGADMPTPRGGVAGATIGGRIFVIGGEGNPEPGTSGVFPDVESYDPASDSWMVHPPMRVPRHGNGAVGLAGRVYVPGGATQQGFGAVATFDVLTPEP